MPEIIVIDSAVGKLPDEIRRAWHGCTMQTAILPDTRGAISAFTGESVSFDEERYWFVAVHNALGSLQKIRSAAAAVEWWNARLANESRSLLLAFPKEVCNPHWV